MFNRNFKNRHLTETYQINIHYRYYYLNLFFQNNLYIYLYNILNLAIFVTWNILLIYQASLNSSGAKCDGLRSILLYEKAALII